MTQRDAPMEGSLFLPSFSVASLHSLDSESIQGRELEVRGGSVWVLIGAAIGALPAILLGAGVAANMQTGHSLPETMFAANVGAMLAAVPGAFFGTVRAFRNWLFGLGRYRFLRFEAALTGAGWALGASCLATAVANEARNPAGKAFFITTLGAAVTAGLLGGGVGGAAASSLVRGVATAGGHASDRASNSRPEPPLPDDGMTAMRRP